MAKQNNSLTEFNALEGIYEHLSTIDDLAKEVGAISSRLRKIEEQLKEPVDINDTPLLQSKQNTYTRDTCISRSFMVINEMYHRIEGYSNDFDVLKKQLVQLITHIDKVHNDQKKFEESTYSKLLELDANTYNYFRLTFIMIIIFGALIVITNLLVK